MGVADVDFVDVGHTVEEYQEEEHLIGWHYCHEEETHGLDIAADYREQPATIFVSQRWEKQGSDCLASEVYGAEDPDHVRRSTVQL